MGRADPHAARPRRGPAGNPAHYPIFLGILGFASAGLLGLALARDPLPRRTLRLTRSWRVPYGALVLFFGWCYAAAARRGSEAEQSQRSEAPVG